MSNSGKSQKRRSSFWKHVGKAFGPDPLEIDLIPPRYSEDSFFSDGPKGGVVVSGQISITHYKPVSFGELKISFIGEALYQDDFSELQSVQIMNEQQILLENATLEPQGSSNPHLLNFTFDISNEKSRNMEPSIRGKIRRCAASISYKLVVSVIDIAPLDRSIVKQLRLYYHHPHNFEGTRLWQGIKDFYGTVRYKIKLPQTGVAGSHFPVSCSCKPITDSTLMRWKDTGSASVNYGGTGDGRLKFQLRLVERMWILVGDGSSSTPRERRINLINEIGEETTGWLSKSQFTPRLPDWSAFTGTEADERVRRRSSISSTPSHGINLDEIDQSTLGLNPSGDFLEGRIHFSHALEIIMVFFDNRTIQHELPFRIVVENPFHTRRDDAFSIYSSPNQVYPSHDDEQAWMLSQEEAAQMSNSMTRAEREFYAHILEPVPPYEGPSEEYLLSQSIPDTVPEDEELNEFTKTPVLLQMSPAESPVFLSPPTNISGLPSPNEPTFGSVSMPEQPETSALDFQKIRLGKSPETNIVQEESPTSEKPPLLAQFFCTTSSSSTSTPSSSSNPRLMQRKQDKRPQTQIHQNANTIDENAESIGPRLPSNPLLRTRSDSLEARVKDSYKRRSAMDFIPHSESLKEVAGMRRGSLRADSGRLFDLSSVNGLNSGESEQTGTMTRKKGVVVRYRELAPPAEDGPSGSQAKTTVLPAEMMLPPSS
ncbi:hypothetical protein HK098_000010 [Nowakowskiella sp. JEL0407]|nr:hypothetical protein HK098_000010 [Nowakowskiella sp. JEL0407]